MSAVDTIKYVLDAGILKPALTIIPRSGASESDIAAEEELLGRTLCRDHIELLRHWNGIALEVIRLFGCGAAADSLGRLSGLQIAGRAKSNDMIVIGSDAAGFVYFQARDGRVYSFDTDGGDTELLAEGIDDLFGRVIFGEDAATFAGDGWRGELVRVGLVK